MPRDLRNLTLSGLWQNDPDVQRLSFEEVTAVVDALILALYADGDVVRPQEENLLEKYLLALPCSFDELVELEGYIEEQRKKAEVPRTREEMQVAAVAIAQRIPAPVRRQVYSMVVAIVVADLELRGKEQAALVLFARAFALTESAAATIFGETVRELGLKPT